MFSIDGIKVVSFFPGRVRLRIDKIKEDQAFGKKVEAGLKSVPGIKKLEVAQDAGTVLVVYDKKTLKQPEVSRLLLKSLKDLFPDVDSQRIKSLLGI